MNSPLHDTVRNRFFAPVITAIESARSKRTCPEYSDRDFIISGVGRVISTVASGRDWVQKIRARLNFSVSVSSFFQSLRSRRRLAFTTEVDEHVRKQVDLARNTSRDPLSKHPELRDYEIYASDGHYEAAASHTQPVRGKVYPPGFFYSLNLRTHSLALLDIARPELKGKKKEHDMSVLKRLKPADLRLGAPKGTKVLHVYDSAVIDYRQWFDWKRKGIYILSLEKANSRATVVGEREIDFDDPRNIGVLADENIGVFSGVMMRRVRYQDPETGKIFSFITNQFTFPPGLIAFLYKLRWDIEKVFDEKKNKLQEKKAWATSAVARFQQALFICIAHNLMILLERELDETEDLRDEKNQAKRQKRLENLKRVILANGRKPNPLVIDCIRATQRSLQFIRWLREVLFFPTSWTAEIAALRPLMTRYLS